MQGYFTGWRLTGSAKFVPSGPYDSDTRPAILGRFRVLELLDMSLPSDTEVDPDVGFFSCDWYDGPMDRGVSAMFRAPDGRTGHLVAYRGNHGSFRQQVQKQPLTTEDNDQDMCQNRLEIWVPVNKVYISRNFVYTTSFFNPFARATDEEDAYGKNEARRLNPELHQTYVLMPGSFKFIRHEHNTHVLGTKRHTTVLQMLANGAEVAGVLGGVQATSPRIQSTGPTT